MKKILVCMMLLGLIGNYASAQMELQQRMALNAPRLYQSYKTGSTLSGIGAGLTLGGVAAIVIGIATADKETVTNGASTQVNLSGTGAGIFAAGIVSTLAGTPLWIIGNTKKRNARNAFLREFGNSVQAPVPPAPHLQLNTTPYGMGMGLAFVF